MNRATIGKAVALLVMVLGAVGLVLIFGVPDIDALQARVTAAGAWAPALFFAIYAVLAFVPVPKAPLTALGGALFGLWAGAGLSLAGAMVGAIGSFGAGRLLGREAVDRLIRGRLARVDALLADHGLSAVLVVRLIPLVPFIAINYASGLTGVRFRHYVLGSAFGMVPGSLAYAALGAYGTDPLGLVLAGSALLILTLGGAWWARRLEARRNLAAADRADANQADADRTDV